MDLVKWLIERQGTTTNVEFARMLRVHESYWSRIRSGKRGQRETVRLARAAIRLYPESELEICRMLLGTGTEVA